MKHAPLRGLRCFPGESTGSMSGKCGWAFDIANLPGRSDVTRPVCADTAPTASMPRIRRPERGTLESSRGEAPVAAPSPTDHRGLAAHPLSGCAKVPLERVPVGGFAWGGRCAVGLTRVAEPPRAT